MTNKDKYIQYISKYSTPIFYSTAWLDSINTNWNCWYFSINDKHFFLPYIEEKKWGFRFLRNPLSIPYQTIIGDVDNMDMATSEELTKAFLVFLQAYHWVELDFKNDKSLDLNILAQQGFTLKPMRTQIINLSTDTLEHHFSKNIKRNIKSASTQFKITTSKDVSTLYNILNSSAQKNNIQNAYQLPMLKALHDAQLGTIWVAKDAQEQIVASAFIVQDKHTAYNLLNGTAYHLPHKGAMALLLQQVLQWSKQQGLQYFDFEGSMADGVHQFYQQFGGDTIPYTRLYKRKSKLLNSLLFVKKWF